jgi:hypothetical protein
VWWTRCGKGQAAWQKMEATISQQKNYQQGSRSKQILIWWIFYGCSNLNACPIVQLGAMSSC